MAKPSLNTPKGPKGPKNTSSDLNDLAAQAGATFALQGDPDFAALWGQINFTGASYEAGPFNLTIDSGAALFNFMTTFSCLPAAASPEPSPALPIRRGSLWQASARTR